MFYWLEMKPWCEKPLLGWLQEHFCYFFFSKIPTGVLRYQDHRNEPKSMRASWKMWLLLSWNVESHLAMNVDPLRVGTQR